MNPTGDHERDRTQGWRSRDKRVGSKQPENKSALFLVKSIKVSLDHASESHTWSNSSNTR